MKKSFLVISWVFVSLLFLMVLVPLAYAADTNTVTSTVVTSVDKTPPTANSPSVVVNNSDICRSGYSGSVQSLRIGISSGQTAVDLNCERIKLARSLYGMGMKVASVALLSQDPRVFDAMWFAGTFPPYKGLIGLDAKEAWENDVAQIPDGAEMKVILAKEHRARLKIKRAAELEREQQELLRAQEEGRKKAKEFFKKLFNPKKMKQLIPLLFLASPLLADSNEVAIDPCPSGVVGLCTPSETSVIIDTLIEEEIIQEPDGVTTITTTTETVETTIVTNIDSGDILHSDSEFVEERYEGDMDQDWGGQGPASMPTGEACRGIEDSGRCAGINGTGSFTTKQGVENVGTTYVQTITPSSSLTNPVTKGGRTTYSIDVDKNDKEDNVYIHITGNNEDGVAFSGTDILSASGVDSGFQTYTGGFDFSGGLTSMTVEIGGRNLGINVDYVLFDNVSINVIYNAIQTIIDYHVTTMELFVALDVAVDDTVTEVIENILVNNDITITPEGDLEIIPIDLPDVEVNYESVELEIDVSIEEFDVPEIESFDTVEAEVEIEVVEVSMEVEEVEVAEVKLEPKPKAEPQPESEPEPEETVENVQKETKQKEPEPNKEPEENQEEAKSEDQDSKQDAKVEKSNTVKDKQQTAAKKILTKMGDKGKYDNTNQIKTLLVMQVLGNTKSFFDDQQVIQDTQGFFPTTTIKDTEILDNGLASFVMFGGSNAKMDRLIDTQYDRRVTWQK